MQKNLLKEQIAKVLTEALQSVPEVHAAWLGGSTATGFEDELSDTDIVAVSQNPEIVFQIIEQTLLTVSAITHVWTVEDSIWKTFSQKFYVLTTEPETYYVDAGVFSSLNPADYREFFNLERHGQPAILFDKLRLLEDAAKNPHQEPPAVVNWENWRARFEIMYRTFLKESQRGKYIDSHVFYQRLVMMWVHLLRHFKTPQKHDFGMRYLYRDLSREEVDPIEKYLKVSSLEEMQGYALKIRKKILAFHQEWEL